MWFFGLYVFEFVLVCIGSLVVMFVVGLMVYGFCFFVFVEVVRVIVLFDKVMSELFFVIVFLELRSLLLLLND